MKSKVKLNAVYAPSEDVVAREIQGELLIIPITSGIGDTEDAIFTLNEVGRAIWENLDRKRSLKEVAGCLAQEFDAPSAEIEKDVLGFGEELLKRRMLVEIKRG